MTVDNPLTLQLAVALGAYILAATAGALAAPQRWAIILGEFKASSALTFLAGVAAFSIGVIILLTHNDWDNTLAVAVNVVAWAAVIEGLVLLAYPKPLYDFADAILSVPIFRPFVAITMIIGGLLLGLGLTGTVAA